MWEISFFTKKAWTNSEFFSGNGLFWNRNMGIYSTGLNTFIPDSWLIIVMSINAFFVVYKKSLFWKKILTTLCKAKYALCKAEPAKKLPNYTLQSLFFKKKLKCSKHIQCWMFLSSSFFFLGHFITTEYLEMNTNQEISHPQVLGNESAMGEQTSGAAPEGMSSSNPMHRGQGACRGL